jgi:hypothetical protein
LTPLDFAAAQRAPADKLTLFRRDHGRQAAGKKAVLLLCTRNRKQQFYKEATWQ